MYPDLPERALSIRQPWACAILHMGKDVENRTWKTGFRGPVAIHAGAGIKRADIELSRAWTGSHKSLSPYSDLDFANEPTGGIVGVATIVNMVFVSDSPWFMGPVGFVLTDVRPVPFIPVPGALNFFKWRERL